MPQQEAHPVIQKIKPSDALTSKGTYATVLLVLFVDAYGMEAVQWNPNTIRMQLDQDYNGKVPAHNFDRLMAAISLLTSNYFFKRLPYFIELCNVLSGDAFNPTVIRLPDVADCAWGITEALIISPPNEEEPLTAEIRAYITHALNEEGFIKPPDILKSAINADHTSQLDDLADDPDMYAAAYSMQQEKTDAIKSLIRDNLRVLLTQLAMLPLAHGETRELEDRLRQNIRPND